MSTLTLYANTGITPSKNRKIESLSDYLSQKSSKVTSLADFQYIRPKLDTSVKVDLSEEYGFSASTNYDYCSVRNGNGELTQYYFIVKSEQRSEYTVEFTLHMDVIATFSSQLTFSPNCVIHREMRDRWEKVSGGTSTATVNALDYLSNYQVTWSSASMMDIQLNLKDEFFSMYPNASVTAMDLYLAPEPATAFTMGNIQQSGDYVSAQWGGSPSSVYGQAGDEVLTDITLIVSYTQTYAIRKIPYKSEGISCVMYKTSETTLTPDHWYLVYKSTNAVDPDAYNQVNPYDLYLVPKDPLPVAYQTNPSYTKTPSDFVNGTYYYIPYEENGALDSDLTKGGVVYAKWLTNSTAGGSIKYESAIMSDGLTFTIYVYKLKCSGTGEITDWTIYKTWTNVTSIRFVNPPQTIYCHEMSNVPAVRPTTFTDTLTFGSYQSGYCKSIDDIDRTDSRLLKIIELPYCPVRKTLINGETRLDNFEFDPTTMTYKAQSLNIRMHHDLSHVRVWDIHIPLNKRLLPAHYVDDALTWYASDDFAFESKLYHSDYYRPTFVYDSFSYVFELEKADISKWQASYYTTLIPKFHFGFDVTNTVNSRFMFSFPEFIPAMSTSDWDSILLVARNNEMTIFSSQYINYLKNGYNYDVKNKERYQTQTAIGGTISALSGVAGAVTGVFSGGTATVGGILGFGSVFNSIYSSALANARAEETLEQKRRSILMSSASVGGSDDLDLLNAYSDNSAKMVTYQPSDEMRQALCTLFHFCGYVSERRGVPNENTRNWWDFVLAEVEFVSYGSTPAWALDEIKQRYAGGLTILHERNGQWDDAQQYENWELSLRQ